MVTIELNETEIKKDLMKSKTMAKFSHYIAGNLYYNIEVFGDMYEFPISTVDVKVTHNVSTLEVGAKVKESDVVTTLSEDLGTTSFNSEIRGSELARWISKSIKNETFIKL
jgi:hypothetical protein